MQHSIDKNPMCCTTLWKVAVNKYCITVYLITQLAFQKKQQRHLKEFLVFKYGTYSFPAFIQYTKNLSL